jgi:hypothetical protein
MKNKPAIATEQARNHNEQGAITARYSTQPFALVHLRGTPEAIPTSCGLAELWGITSIQDQMRFCLFVNENDGVPFA